MVWNLTESEFYFVIPVSTYSEVNVSNGVILIVYILVSRIGGRLVEHILKN